MDDEGTPELPTARKTTGAWSGWLVRPGAALVPAAPLARFPAARSQAAVDGYGGRVLATLADATLETDPAIGP